MTQYQLGRSLGVTGVTAGDQINVDFFGAEAGYRNQFRIGSTTVVDNTGNMSWSERDRGNYNLARQLQHEHWRPELQLLCGEREPLPSQLTERHHAYLEFGIHRHVDLCRWQYGLAAVG